MYCEHCGKEISASAIYCRHCGLKVNEVQREMVRTSMAAVFQGFLTDPPFKSGGSGPEGGGSSIGKIAIALFAITIIAILGLSFALILLPNMAKSPVPPSAIKETFYLISPNVSVHLSGEYPLSNGSFNTTFFSGQKFYPVEDGLPKDSVYTFRVLCAGGSECVPLAKYGFNVTKTDAGREAPGVAFNSGLDALEVGRYTIELIEAEGTIGVVVSALNFTITPAPLQPELAEGRASPSENWGSPEEV